MEVYVDDMLVKSKVASDHVAYLANMFWILWTYRMKLNPLKCAFGVASGNFLGFMVNQRGIVANPEKLQALLDMCSPSKTQEVQSLIGRVVALNRFISKATDKCLPFFESLKGNKRFLWDDKCEQAFKTLKEYLGKPSLLEKLVEGELLFLYLAVFEYAILGALIGEEEKVQWPVYYISKRLINAENRYPEMEKLTLGLVIASRKLRLYFHSHTIRVLTNYPLRQVLQKPDASGCLLKWAIELSQFDIEFLPQPAIKGQALVDFIAEFTTPEGKQPDKVPTTPKTKILT